MSRPISQQKLYEAGSGCRDIGSQAAGAIRARRIDVIVVYKVDRLTSDDMKGFVVLPCRWVVERTFSWFGRNRRLAKDYENLADTLAAFVTLAAIQLGIRRLARA
jgi:transposase